MVNIGITRDAFTQKVAVMGSSHSSTRFASKCLCVWIYCVEVAASGVRSASCRSPGRGVIQEALGVLYSPSLSCVNITMYCEPMEADRERHAQGSITLPPTNRPWQCAGATWSSDAGKFASEHFRFGTTAMKNKLPRVWALRWKQSLRKTSSYLAPEWQFCNLDCPVQNLRHLRIEIRTTVRCKLWSSLRICGDIGGASASQWSHDSFLHILELRRHGKIHGWTTSTICSWDWKSTILSWNYFRAETRGQLSRSGLE